MALTLQFSPDTQVNAPVDVAAVIADPKMQTALRSARGPGVYAEDYGVRGDGVTGNYEALQSAIDDTALGVNGGQGNALLLPAGIIGLDRQPVQRNKVRLVGAGGKRSTWFKALPEFPINTPIVRQGSPGQPFEFDMRLENVGIDCSDIEGSSGVYSSNANEGSGCFGVVVTGFNKYGVWYDQGCSVIGSQDLELFSGTLGSALAGFYAFRVAGQNWVKGVTTIPTTGAGMIIQQCQYAVSDIHAEASEFGIRVNDSVNCQISNVSGHPACPILVQLDSNTGKCSVQSVFANGSATSLKDDFKSVTISADFMSYAQDDVRIGANRMGSGTAAPSTGAHARGEIVWNATPAASGFMGWTCVTAGTPGTWKTFGAISA